MKLSFWIVESEQDARFDFYSSDVRKQKSIVKEQEEKENKSRGRGFLENNSRGLLRSQCCWENKEGHSSIVRGQEPHTVQREDLGSNRNRTVFF